MNRRFTNKVVLPFLAFALLAAACGSAETSTVTDSGTDVTNTTDASAPDDPSQSTTESTATRAQPAADSPVEAWVDGINTAGWSFHQHLEGNAVSSPVSIGVAFSLASAGASRDTAAVLVELFGFPETGVHQAANAVGQSLAAASAGPTTLEVANRLFPDDTFTPLAAFLDIAATDYGATIEKIDTADGAAASDTINSWVSDTTRGLIPEIVNPAAVQDQQLFLVNTVYLKADWANPFLPEFTSDRPFTVDDSKIVTVPFMRDRIPVNRSFVRLDGADAVELPYEGGELAMWIVVPHDDATLAEVEATVDGVTLGGLTRSAEQGLVELTMPKWEQTLPPTDLFAWTCPQGFCAGAGFDGIAPGIAITSALHGAKIIVDEKGTEAAAATSMGFDTSGPPPPDLTVVADRPFLWAITHGDTGAIVFLGRLQDPSA